MNYDEMSAGREMDALVAEKVMVDVPCKKWRYFHADQMIKGDCGHSDCVPEEHWPRPYSTSISAALDVMEHFRQRQWKVELVGHEWYDGGSWECVLLDALNDERARAFDRQVHDGKSGWPEPSAPLAICRAALKAVDTPA